MFTFHQLCAEALGAADYIAIASAYKTVFVKDIVEMDVLLNDDVLRRFITLVDTLYEYRVRLVCSADAPWDGLVVERSKSSDANHGDLLGTSVYVPVAEEEKFAFGRMVSRLTEMQSAAYLKGCR
jgi:protein AFG1